MSYPGTAPAWSYVLVGDDVVPVPDAGGGGPSVDDLLAAAGAAPVAERVAVVAYGANRSPRTLALKMDHHDGGSAPVAVPVLAARLADVDVVVGGASGQGYLYADLTPSPGTDVQVAVALLDEAQLGAVHRSEGVGRGGYEVLALADVALVDDGARVEALVYAGSRPVVVSPATGTPLAFAAIGATGRRLPADDQRGLLAHVLAATGAGAGVAGALGLGSAATAIEVAEAFATTVNRAWWAAHRGGAPAPAADRARAVLAAALDRHRPGRPTAELLAGRGRRLGPDDPHGARAAGRP